MIEMGELPPADSAGGASGLFGRNLLLGIYWNQEQHPVPVDEIHWDQVQR